MNKQEAAQNILNYVVKKSTFSPENLESYVLTGKCINELSKDDLLEYTVSMQDILTNYIVAMEEADIDCQNNISLCGRMFQYVFDKSFEIAYKLIINTEVDTLFIPVETFDYYELDIPEYLQLKVNNIIGHLAILHCNTFEYIVDNKYNKNPLKDWLLPLLLGASTIAIQFAMEMDLNDDSEMRHYLYDE